jgi:hypothetical protein
MIPSKEWSKHIKRPFENDYSKKPSIKALKMGKPAVIEPYSL